MFSTESVKQFLVGAEKSTAPAAMSSFKGAALAKRKVSNKTGIDMFVPKFDTSQGAGRETLYHVIVISVLSVFKEAKHTAEDVVQFSVARKYVDFEKLQERLSVEFSAIVFPPLPPRRLYCSEDDLEDRLVAFDSMIRVVAKTRRLSRSHSVLRFLGASDKVIDTFLKEEAEKEKRKGEVSKVEGASQDSEHVAEPEVDIFAEEEEEENNEGEAAGDEVDEFGEALSLSPPKTSAKMRGSMVTHDGGEDVAGYLLAAGASGNADRVFSEKLTADRTKELTDASGELFQVDDQLDSIDHLSKPTKKKAKIHAKAKPKLLDESDGTLTDKQFASIDLQQYIASNTAAASADVDLFS